MRLVVDRFRLRRIECVTTRSGRGGAGVAVFGTPLADYTRALMAGAVERCADMKAMTHQDGTASGQGREGA